MKIDEFGNGFGLRREGFALPPIHILEEDYDILADIVCGSTSATAGIELLWRELERAVILPTGQAPQGLIHLNSTVGYTDLTDPLHRTVQLVSPGRRSRRGVSVASSVGAALIGLKVGDRFPWVSPHEGLRMLRVDRVAADPDAQDRVAGERLAARRRLIAELLSAR
ncbi:GreA/GreB family elongation factor [Phenylobacterium sp.]|uniref:GreA/GreB family elongation factor n=1 Tax=Phenylobacterium sp. TaxID=1871053 RepID=UPI00356A0ED5